MGLFDIFKRKEDTADTVNGTSTQSTVNPDELNLDQLIEKASKDALCKAAFNDRILKEELIVISVNVNVSEGYQYLEAGTSVELFSLPDGSIPLFTTIDRIFDNGVVKEDVEFLKMSGADLFGMAEGETFVVNPYSACKKKILPAEVNTLLNGHYY